MRGDGWGKGDKMTEANDTVGKDVIPMPVLLYGRSDSEGTSLVRERMNMLDISFVEVDVDHDAEARRLVEGITLGKLATPVLVFGDQEMILVEPSVDALDKALRQAGYEVK
jgi:hypothetical protein